MSMKFQQLLSRNRSAFFCLILWVGAASAVPSRAIGQQVSNSILSATDDYLFTLDLGNNGGINLMPPGTVDALQSNFLGLGSAVPGGWSLSLLQWQRLPAAGPLDPTSIYKNVRTGKVIDIDCDIPNPIGLDCRGARLVPRDDASGTIPRQLWENAPIGPCKVSLVFTTIVFPNCTANLLRQKGTGWCATVGQQTDPITLQDCGAPPYPLD